MELFFVELEGGVGLEREGEARRAVLGCCWDAVACINGK